MCARYSSPITSTVLLCAALCGVPTVAAQSHPTRYPAELRIVPEGRLLRVELVDGRVLFARMVAEGEPLRLGLADGDVVELPRAAAVRIREVRGHVRGGEFRPDAGDCGGLLFAPLAARLLASGQPGDGGVRVTALHAVAAGPRTTVLAGVSGAATEPLASTALLGVTTRMLALRRLSFDLGVSGAMSGAAPHRSGASATATTHWQYDPDTEVSVRVGGALAAGGARLVASGEIERRLERRWAVAVETARPAHGAPLVAAGVRFLGDQFVVDTGLGSGASTAALSPLLQVSHRR